MKKSMPNSVYMCGKIIDNHFDNFFQKEDEYHFMLKER